MIDNCGGYHISYECVLQVCVCVTISGVSFIHLNIFAEKELTAFKIYDIVTLTSFVVNGHSYISGSALHTTYPYF